MRSADTAQSPAIAWVESPLQLVAAAEWAETQPHRIVVALRITSPQMPATAAELLSRGARFAECVPYFGIPWQLLSRHRSWAVGDAFSGQFRLAAAVRPPQSLTLLDDGSQATAIVDALVGRTSFGRPHQRDSAALTTLGILARDRMLALAARDRLEIATAFEFGAVRTVLLSDQRIPVTSHRFDWVRRTARPIAVPGNRVLLGSALPTDGRMPVDRYLRWVRSEAADAPLIYLPHRRETAAVREAVAAIAGVRIFDSGLPVELVLAGAQEPLEVITLPTSARTTLTHILEGTGSSIRTRSLHRESIR
ncbi:hypothetical protein [Lacisediminihabitans sp. H27-G8]|uniref:hypothetical protein n=1 Tax=Lacisediminihabitans sp. H27-G8 TaxID=3111909 RepID=UPI0038FC388F